MSNLKTSDPSIYNAIQHELERQRHQLEMIASENIVSYAVLEAQGSIMTNKYAEGYPGRRYYNGCEFVDVAEDLARDRAKQLYNCAYANVQPHSGSQANQQVFFALLQPGDTFLGMALDSGGHLTHGSHVNQSGKWFKPVHYHVDPKTYLIDYDQVENLAKTHRPKLIIAGGSAYPRTIDFARFRAIADSVGAYFMVDMAHFSGLVAGGAFPSPLPHAHVVTTTTHKTLRGPRGGMILSNDEELGKKFNSAVFPGCQGGPLMHVIAAKAVAFKEALDPSFKEYAAQVITNAKALSERLMARGYDVLTGGTDCHLVLLNLKAKGLNGKDAANLLEEVGIACNMNSVPFDDAPPTKPSGIRLGSPALTTRGLKEADFQEVADLIADTLDQHGHMNEDLKGQLQKRGRDICDRFPIYEGL